MNRIELLRGYVIHRELQYHNYESHDAIINEKIPRVCDSRHTDTNVNMLNELT